MPLGYFRKMEDAVNAFFGRFQILFNFATEKFVVIKDWRLGLVLRLLQIGILIYVLYDVINQASYLIQEIPKGTVNPSADVSSSSRKQSVISQRRFYRKANLQYCNDSKTEYEYTYNDVDYNNFQCVLMDPLAIPETGEMEFFMTTYIRLDKVFYVDVNNSTTDCPNSTDVAEIPNDATKVGLLYGVCMYNSHEQYFTIGPEEIPLEILHSYYTSVVDASGTLPETIIRAANYDKKPLHFDGHQPVTFKLKELLDTAGIDLDKRLDEQPNENGHSDSAKNKENNLYPYARLSGVDIVMRFKYFHRALAPKRYRISAGPKTRDVICIVELMPRKVWSVDGPNVEYQISDADHPFIINPARQLRTVGVPEYNAVQVDFERHGVRLTFQVSGNMGKFNFIYLVNALIAGAVLLGVAQTIVTYIALYALGLSSQLYMEFMRESVNWRREYARFATQSLVAGDTFMRYDANNSGTLDRKEIYEHLSKIFKNILDPPKLACLADFLMRHGEMDADVSKGRVEDVSDLKISTINMGEWIDIFTPEKVKIDTLGRLVTSEYDREELIGPLLALAEGRIGRNISHMSLLTEREAAEGSQPPDISKYTM